MEDSSQHEVLNWIALAGAMTEMGMKVEVIDYVESYIFDSAKCFALFPPRQQRAGAEPETTRAALTS